MISVFQCDLELLPEGFSEEALHVGTREPSVILEADSQSRKNSLEISSPLPGSKGTPREETPREEMSDRYLGLVAENHAVLGESSPPPGLAGLSEAELLERAAAEEVAQQERDMELDAQQEVCGVQSEGHYLKAFAKGAIPGVVAHCEN